jgi:hypothetical protein
MSAFGDSAGLALAARTLGEAADALDQQRRSLAGVVAELLSGADAWAGQASAAFAASFAK